MATTVNNTTANSKITIIFDAGVNPISANDGPRLGTGNTESDVIIFFTFLYFYLIIA